MSRLLDAIVIASAGGTTSPPSCPDDFGQRLEWLKELLGAVVGEVR